MRKSDEDFILSLLLIPVALLFMLAGIVCIFLAGPIAYDVVGPDPNKYYSTAVIICSITVGGMFIYVGGKIWMGVLNGAFTN